MRQVVLAAGGLLRGASGAGLATLLGRHPGIHHAEINCLSDTVTIGYDETAIAESEIICLIEQRGSHCRGEVSPSYLPTPRPDTFTGHRLLVLEQVTKLHTVLFDRTGTLRVGSPHVIDVVTVDEPLSEDGLIWLVASAEQPSEHPLAQAVVRHAKERGLKLAEPTTFEAIPGHGLRATVDERTVLVGNHKLMRDSDIMLKAMDERATRLDGAGRTVVYVAVDGQAAGIIAIADAIQPTSCQMVTEMEQLGIQE